MPVDEVGTGVGYLSVEVSVPAADGALWMRLAGLGRHGDDGCGSNAGSNEDGAGLLTPATLANLAFGLLGDGLISIELSKLPKTRRSLFSVSDPVSIANV